MSSEEAKPGRCSETAMPRNDEDFQRGFVAGAKWVNAGVRDELRALTEKLRRSDLRVARMERRLAKAKEVP